MLSPNSAYLVKSRRRTVRAAAPTAQAATVPGTWRYRAPKATTKAYTAALLLSVALHSLVMLAFNRPDRPAPAPVRAAEPIIQMEMTLPQEDPAPEEVEDMQEPEPQSAVAVPQLADIPSTVALNAFTQEIDLRPATNIDLSGAQLVNIPVHIGRGSGRGAGGDLFNLADLDRAPEPISQTAPQFPYAMKSAGVTEARVLVGFVVDSEGRVTGAHIVDATHMGFEASALSAVSRWKFRPGMKAGRKVGTRMMVPIKFQIVEEV